MGAGVAAADTAGCGAASTDGEADAATEATALGGVSSEDAAAQPVSASMPARAAAVSNEAFMVVPDRWSGKTVLMCPMRRLAAAAAVSVYSRVTFFRRAAYLDPSLVGLTGPVSGASSP